MSYQQQWWPFQNRLWNYTDGDDVWWGLGKTRAFIASFRTVILGFRRLAREGVFAGHEALSIGENLSEILATEKGRAKNWQHNSLCRSLPLSSLERISPGRGDILRRSETYRSLNWRLADMGLLAPGEVLQHYELRYRLRKKGIEDPLLHRRALHADVKPSPGLPPPDISFLRGSSAGASKPSPAEVRRPWWPKKRLGGDRWHADNRHQYRSLRESRDTSWSTWVGAADSWGAWLNVSCRFCPLSKSTMARGLKFRNWQSGSWFAYRYSMERCGAFS